MYEPYQPDRTPDPEPAEGTGRPSALGECPCVVDGRFCSPDCEQCPVDCPARQQVPHTWEQIPQYEEPAGHVDRQPSSWTSTSSRRRTSRRRSSSRSSFDWGTGSSSSGRSSSSASGSSRTPSKGKKAGAGLGAAIAAGAGGVGALSNGADGSSDAQPDSNYHSDYGIDDDNAFDGSSFDDLDRYAVVDRAPAPIAAFRLKSDNRLVVVSGSWSKDPSSYACDIEVDVTEFADRVVIEASAPITRRDQERGRTCPAPSVWATEKHTLWLDEPLGDRQVVTSGPLLDGGVESDPPGEAEVPQKG